MESQQKNKRISKKERRKLQQDMRDAKEELKEVLKNNLEVPDELRVCLGDNFVFQEETKALWGENYHSKIDLVIQLKKAQLREEGKDITIEELRNIVIPTTDVEREQIYTEWRRLNSQR